MIKPIETRYQGYRFRSRLEARWACFFDALGLKWEYEPEGFELEAGRYLPDFKVYYPGRCESESHHQWFEVKGDLKDVSHDEWAKMLEFQKKCHLIVLDGTPDARMYLFPSHIVAKTHYDAEVGSPIPTPYKANSESLSHERCGYAVWSGKGRVWWDEHENFFSPTTYFGSDTSIEDAADAAKSARFEFGESGPSKKKRNLSARGTC